MHKRQQGTATECVTEVKQEMYNAHHLAKNRQGGVRSGRIEYK